MDLNIAKKHLIILLAILNIFLLFSIISHNNNVSIDNPYFSKETLKNLDKLLSEKGIILNAELPKNYDSVEIVYFEYVDINSKNYPNLFSKFENIEITNNFKKALVKSSYTNVLKRNRKIDTLELREQFAKEFISDYLDDKNYDLKIKSENEIIYNPIINNMIYEDSYLKFKFFDDRFEVEILSISPQDYSSVKRKVISPVEAILAIIPRLQNGDKIDRIDLIYYFELEESELYKVKNARALPSWRIITEKQQVLYVFAFNE